MEEIRFPPDPADPVQNNDQPDASGGDVKIYSSDRGHQLGPQPGADDDDHADEHHAGRLAAMNARCHEQFAERPWTVLGVAALAAGAVGAVAGYCCGKRHDNWF